MPGGRDGAAESTWHARRGIGQCLQTPPPRAHHRRGQLVRFRRGLDRWTTASGSDGRALGGIALRRADPGRRRSSRGAHRRRATRRPRSPSSSLDKADQIRWAATSARSASVALLWFLGAVWRLLRRAEGGEPRLAVVAVTRRGVRAGHGHVGGIMLSVLGIVGRGRTGGASEHPVLLPPRVEHRRSPTAFGLAVFVGAFSVGDPPDRRAAEAPRLVRRADRGRVRGRRRHRRVDARRVLRSVASAAFIAFSLWLLVVSIMMLPGSPPRRRRRLPSTA